MIDAQTFTDIVLRRGYEFFSGVPCSHLAGPIELLSRKRQYVPAANEGAALSIAAGARLAGARSAVLLQNSGLGNLVNPLASLVLPYRIPLLLLVSMRGWPLGTDEPQHEVMGAATWSVVDSCGVSTALIQPNLDSLEEALDLADKAGLRSEPFCVLIPRGTVADAEADADACAAETGLDPRAAVRIVAEFCTGDPVISTTGYTSRELFSTADHASHFYMQGSMGHALALGLGAALRRPDRRTVVLDGDGAVLMHMGTLSTVGHAAPENLLHIVLDNGVYASTGGQATTSASVNWPALALANGYRLASRCRSESELVETLRRSAHEPGPNLVAVEIRGTVTPAPARASSRLTLPGIRARFERQFGVA